MNAHLKLRRTLLEAIHSDLARPHAFAHERVGFLSASAARIGRGSLLLLARDYVPVEDEDYLDDPSVGAMMSSAAISKALQRAYQTKTVALHVHCHGHRGRPEFSGVDVRENAKFVPNFFNVAAQMPHGALLLSRDNAAGAIWLARDADPIAITRFTGVGAPLWLIGDDQ